MYDPRGRNRRTLHSERAVTPDRDGLTASAVVTIEDIREAASGLIGVAERTPLVPAPALSQKVGHAVYLKLESRQPTGAFKLRGAWTAVCQLAPAERARGVITYSSGNHGQAVAFAAQRQGIRAVIVMPETVPEAKLEGVKRWGGEVVLAGKTSEDRFNKAQEIVAAEGLTVIPPFDHPHIIAGQGTVGLEIVEDLPEVAGVAVPVGGGGLCAGVTTAIHALSPGAHVWAVEPVGSSAYAAAVYAGRPVRLDAVASVADGLLPLSVGTLTFQHMYPRAQSVTVTDTDIVAATKWLRDELDVIAEPSGATTTAAMRSGAIQPDGPTVLVVSGGNIRPESIDRLAPVG